MKRRCRFYLLVTRKRHHIHCPPFTTLKAVICFCREYVTWFFCIVPTGEPMFHNIPARVLSCSLITSCVLQIHVKISILLLIASPSVVCQSRKNNFPHLTYFYVVPTCVVTAVLDAVMPIGQQRPLWQRFFLQIIWCYVLVACGTIASSTNVPLMRRCAKFTKQPQLC